MTKISTHTLTWSVTRSSAGRPDRTEYFNSHAHVERDRLVRSARLCKIISTHTLTWSVTYRYFQGFPSLPYFNSHAHVERDFNSRSNSLVLHISTHTLTWSVTCAWRRALKTYGHFNSHAHVERDNRKTPPHFDNWHFNSHAHVERDFWELGILNAKKISTHTLTWSVTTVRSFLALSIPFQLTRSRGA